jgi:hypothetical protein
MDESGMMLPKSSMEKKNQQQQQIQLKLSTIFKQKVSDTRQSFGSFYDTNGEKYCAISVLSKYLGYDIAATSKKTQNGKNTYPAQLIPNAILEKIENFTAYSNPKKNIKCFCSRPDYLYSHSLISLLIHLNDYHKMTFTQIGNWLESKGI